MIPRRPPAYPRTEETFSSRTGLTFDPLAGAEAASNLTVGLMLNPQRAARLVEYHARQSDNPGFEEVVDTLLAATWQKPVPPGLDGQVARRVNSVVLIHLIGLALDGSAPPAVRSVALSAIGKIKGSADPYSLDLIETFEKTPDQLELPKPLEPPPGQPIGEDGPSFIN
jgi:hypothetical protein